VGSEATRTSKVGGIAIKGGALVLQTLGTGVEGYFNINPRFQVGLDYYRVRGSKAKFGWYWDPFRPTVDEHLFELYAKYFVGNSFALTGGLTYSRSDESFTTSDNKTEIANFNSEVYALKVGLGNYWAFDFGLTLGCEWVGAISESLFSSSSYSYATASTAETTATYRELVENRKRKYKNEAHLQLLNVTVGYTF
jgi:hypothetical protein